MQSKKTPDRPYPLASSPLYGIRGKGQFERAIGLTWDQTDRLLHRRYYRVWTTKKDREIQQPLYELEKLHARIANLLARIEMPSYVFSRRGRSYVENADRHKGLSPLIKTDLTKFYPSTSWPMVFRLLVSRFNCAKDVAHRLADLCCYQQKHLPTGSALSGYLAFFAAQPMFDRIADILGRHGCEMTLFVDDLTASGAGATKHALEEVRAEIRHHGFATSEAKSKVYRAAAPKLVTGAIVTPTRLMLPNKQHLKIWAARRSLPVLPKIMRAAALRALRGRIQQAHQVLNYSGPTFELAAPVEPSG
ncbi:MULTISPECIES: reverse transcriptase family protein [unclassified Variovorax]|uniref:reverse transcriptase family protein n=1 Tax=unclassified Variovorax TaxID=663243 RepID=UPI0008ADEE9F|nr:MULTISPECIES: reverse transcriptase family protein [unclassified Variovorax]SEK17403.1 Reverse transcriptase (RNA-dependent DNA polymerase) [Variovorax sp. OK202]SFE83076.1 Reverse transcriptase (RNA-dependent DNA polymerase) [Variovorax sp. OK212]